MREHGPMVTMLSTQSWREMGLSNAERSELLLATFFADMGMVGFAEDAWANPVPEPPPPDVRTRVYRHPARYEERVTQIPHLEALAPLVRHHHERWDGGRYPEGMSGALITMIGQIVAVCDAYDAITSDRA